MAPQAKGRVADYSAGDRADDRAEWDAEPWRQIEMDHPEGHGIGAEPPERSMPEREIAAVAAQNIPGQRQYRPQQNLSKNQLIIRALNNERDQQKDDRDRQDRPALSASWGIQVRSLSRPNNPCGRRKMINRKTTKIAVFCSWYGRIKVDICWTMPMSSP